MLLAASALALGFLHGLGADHLMAIAALSVGSAGDAAVARRGRALAVAVRFACGHALLLAFGAGLVLAFGWSIPVVVERGGEALGGALLIALGAAGLWAAAAGRVYGHAHPSGGRPRAHLHVGRPARHPRPAAHFAHLPTLLGAVFAVSSLRALSLLAPFGGSVGEMTVAALLGLVATFAVGILLSMSLFGVALARVMSAPVVDRLGRLATGAMAAASILLGAYWMAGSV